MIAQLAIITIALIYSTPTQSQVRQEDTIHTQSQIGQEDTVSAQSVFYNQILLDMDVAVATSPDAAMTSEWVERASGWAGGNAQSLFALVHISEGLIDAAVNYWAEDHKDITAQQREFKRAEVMRKASPPGERTFLLIIRPIVKASYPEWWQLQIDRPLESFKILTLDNKAGRALRFDPIFNRRLGSADGSVSGLIYMQDVADIDRYLNFNVYIDNIFHHIRTSDKGWIKAANPMSLLFRFETSDVHLIKLVNAGIPWDSIYQKHLIPSRKVLDAKSSPDFVSFMLDVALPLVMKVALKM